MDDKFFLVCADALDDVLLIQACFAEKTNGFLVASKAKVSNQLQNSTNVVNVGLGLFPWLIVIKSEFVKIKDHFILHVGFTLLLHLKVVDFT